MEKDAKKLKQAIIVAGPTGSGKTAFGIKLAKVIGGDIINADSRQVYRGLDIGTGKGLLTPTQEFIALNDIELQGFDMEHSGVTGWLFDLVNPDERFDVSKFYRYASELMEIIYSSGKIPVIVGGTGLYIDALLKGYRLPEVFPDPALRERLSKMSVTRLQAELEQVAPARFKELNNSDRNNPRRLIRAIEIASQPTVPARQDLPDLSGWNFTMLYPVFEREALFAAIDSRVAQMFKDGIVRETELAIKNGYAATEILNGFSYLEAQKLLSSELTEAEAIALSQRGHRNYAKRQITWFEGKGRGYNLQRIAFTKT